MKLKVRWGPSAKCRVVGRVGPNSPNDPACLLSTHFLQLNPTTLENKIKTCTSQIKARPITPITLRYSDISRFYQIWTID
ncbi:hypothetical protein H5410_003169 [Solanum commersonii]|uniref:Uncharacterized protein n=1 Tax=Solanum commersonii TaxID=4109 RepID=A0A9J6B499_SOLCO|nr:hypothetical protein H5410_003169 [Solanum commersonii]